MAVVVAAGVVALIIGALQRRAAPAPVPGAQAAASPQPTPAAVRPSSALSNPIAAVLGTRIEICGHGSVAVTDPDRLPPELEAILNGSKLFQRAIAELGASGSPSDRAVALVHEAMHATLRTMETASAGSRNCSDDASCQRAVGQMAMQAAAPYYQALVQLAEQTTDPVAYSLAHDACQRIRGGYRPAGCAVISASRWAEIEPDNGVPWLQLAAEARQRGDESAVRDALARAATAQRFDNHATDLMRPILTPAARGAALLERSNLQGQVMDPAGGMIVPGGYHDAVLFCRAGEDAARKALCDQLATQLVEKDTTLLGRAIGRAIGARAGWPAERVAALKDEHEAMVWMQMRDSPEPQAMLGCEGLAAAERRLLDVMRRGEVGSLRQEMIRTGRTPAELAREYRAHQKREREGAAVQK